MESLIRKCIKDMETVAVSGKYSLDAQVRAYDLLEQLLDLYYDLPLPAGLKDVAAEFCSVYEANASVLDSAFDSSALAAAAADVLKPLNEACNEARFEAAAAASLHEFAKALAFGGGRYLGLVLVVEYTDGADNKLLGSYARDETDTQLPVETEGTDGRFELGMRYIGNY